MEWNGCPSLHSLLSSRCVSGVKTWQKECLYSYLYKGIQTRGGFDGQQYGSVFNIRFSPMDKLALAVCSGMCVIGYDPRMRVNKPVCEISPAHNDCANCITFINNHAFTTCSDDMTIRMWDLRNFGKCTQTLKGHQNWIKNIEYDKYSGKLFSVAFFDGVREWDLNSLQQYRNNDTPDNLVLKLTDPVRMRLAPDSSKMFISTRRSKCCIIDRFNGETLSECSSLVEEMMENLEPKDLSDMTRNRPAVHIMSNSHSRLNFRAIMSVEFHPNSELAAIRYVDVDGNELDKERISMYDFGSSDGHYQSHYTFEQTACKYFKEIDEMVLIETVDFIKEFCFSPDGRIIASPHGKGVRLLATDDLCTPIDVYKDDRFVCEGGCKDSELQVINDLAIGGSFSSSVLSCRFAHEDFVLATGGYSGEFLFHQPRL